MFKIQLNPNVTNLKESATLAINEKAKEQRQSGKTVYHWGFGQSPFPVHEKIVEELKNYAHVKDYLPTQGLLELRQAIARHLGNQVHQRISPEQILIGPGSKELIFQALFSIEGDVIIPAPSWVSYKPQVDLRSQRTRTFLTHKEDNYHIRPDEFDRYCQELGGGQKILIVNNPANPTGLFYRRNEVKAIAEVCKKNKVIIISDEIYSQIIFTGDKYTSFTEFFPEGTLVTGGLSKIFSGGGYRLGFMSIPEIMVELKKAIIAMISETFSAVAAPIQYAAVKAYSLDEDILNYIHNCTEIHKQASTYLHDRLTRMGVDCSRPEGAFYLFIDFENYREEFNKRGLKTSIDLGNYFFDELSLAMLPGTDFYYPDNKLCFRIATVDYDGEKVYHEYLNSTKTGAEFIEANCPSLKEGCDVLEKFLKSL